MDELKKILKEGALIGLGLVVLTKEKIEEFAQKMQKDYNLTPEEGKRVVKELLIRSEKTTKNLEAEIEKQINLIRGKIAELTKKKPQKFVKKKNTNDKVAKRAKTKK